MSETFESYKTDYGDVTMKHAICFKTGCQTIENYERSGHLSTSTDDSQVAEINTLVSVNQRLTIRDLAEKCAISVGSFYEILIEKLIMYWVAAKLVLCLITDHQKADRSRLVGNCLNVQC